MNDSEINKMEMYEVTFESEGEEFFDSSQNNINKLTKEIACIKGVVGYLVDLLVNYKDYFEVVLIKVEQLKYNLLTTINEIDDMGDDKWQKQATQIKICRDKIDEIFRILLAVYFDPEYIQIYLDAINSLFFIVNSKVSVKTQAKKLEPSTTVTNLLIAKFNELKELLEKNENEIFDLLSDAYFTENANIGNSDFLDFVDTLVNILENRLKNEIGEFNIQYLRLYKEIVNEFDNVNYIIPKNYVALLKLKDLQHNIIEYNSKKIVQNIKNPQEVLNREDLSYNNMKQYAMAFQNLLMGNDDNENAALEILKYFIQLVCPLSYPDYNNLIEHPVQNIAYFAMFLNSMSEVSAKKNEKVINMIIEMMGSRVFDLISESFKQEEKSTVGRENTIISNVIKRLVLDNKTHKEYVLKCIQPIIDIMDKQTVKITKEFTMHTITLMCADGKPELTNMKNGIYLYKDKKKLGNKKNKKYDIYALVIYNNDMAETLNFTNLDIGKKYTNIMSVTTNPSSNRFITIENKGIGDIITSKLKNNSYIYAYEGDGIDQLTRTFSVTIDNLFTISKYSPEIQRIIHDFAIQNETELLGYLLIRFINPIILNYGLSSKDETMQFWCQNIIIIALQALGSGDTNKESTQQKIHPTILNLVYNKTFREKMKKKCSSAKNIDVNQLIFEDHIDISIHQPNQNQTVSHHIKLLNMHSQYLKLLEVKLIELCNAVKYINPEINNNHISIEQRIDDFPNKLHCLKTFLDDQKQIEKLKLEYSEETTELKKLLIYSCFFFIKKSENVENNNEFFEDDEKTFASTITTNEAYFSLIIFALNSIKTQQINCFEDSRYYQEKIKPLFLSNLNENEADILKRIIEQTCNNILERYKSAQESKVIVNDKHFEHWKQLNNDYQQFFEKYKTMFTSNASVMNAMGIFTPKTPSRNIILTKKAKTRTNYSVNGLNSDSRNQGL